MASYQVLLNQNLNDFNPILAGSAASAITSKGNKRPAHYALIHFVLSGKGYITINDKRYPVCGGQAFFVPMGSCAYVEPDEEDPWAFQWIGFNGEFSQKSDLFPTVFDIPQEIQKILCDPGDTSFSPEALAYQLAAELMLLYARLYCQPSVERTDYVQEVREYVQRSYSKKISVEDLAASLGLSRSHLTELFHKRTGQSIREYILAVRVHAAKQYLMQGRSVKETAILCGIDDRSNFVKLFKRETGRSPTEWIAWVQSNIEIFEKEKNIK